jgi:hypothetical protein
MRVFIRALTNLFSGKCHPRIPGQIARNGENVFRPKENVVQKIAVWCHPRFWGNVRGMANVHFFRLAAPDSGRPLGASTHYVGSFPRPLAWADIGLPRCGVSGPGLSLRNFDLVPTNRGIERQFKTGLTTRPLAPPKN